MKLLRLPPWRVGTKLTCLVLLHKNPTAGLPNITKTQTFKHQNVWLFVNKNSSAISGEKIEKSGRGAPFVAFFSPKGDTTQRISTMFLRDQNKTRQIYKLQLFFLMLLFQPQCFYRCIKWGNMATPNGPGVRLPKKPFHWPRSLQRNKARAFLSAFLHTLL